MKGLHRIYIAGEPGPTYFTREDAQRALNEAEINEVEGPCPNCEEDIGHTDHCWVKYELGRECEICGEEFGANDERAEMYDPAWLSGGSVLCHAQCGLNKGLEVA